MLRCITSDSLWDMPVVGGHLFGFLGIIFPGRSSARILELGSRKRHAIMRYRETQVYCLWTCFHSSVSRHSVTGTRRCTTEYANYSNHPFPLGRASMPPTRGKTSLAAPYYLLNLLLSPPSQINSYPRKTSHPPVLFLKHILNSPLSGH
jgi:hypothetical protein